MDPLGELRREVEGPQVAALDVLAIGLELVLRPPHHDAGQAVVRRDRAPAAAPLGADVDVEGIGRQVAPVRVVARLQRRDLVVALGLHGLGHERVLAVGADDDARGLRDRRAAANVSADAGHAAVVEQHLLDGERGAHLGARRGGGLEEQRVEHDPARAVGRRVAIHRPRRSRDRERPEVIGVLHDRRAVRGFERLEHTPPRERGHAGRMDEVRRQRVAGKRRLVDEQDAVAAARQQHRGGRPSAARADDDRVVHRGHLRPPCS